MKTLKTVVATLVVAAILIPLAVLGIIYSGAYNVAATSEHWPVTKWLLNQTVQHSIAARAENIEMPALGAQKQVLAGAANYEAMCAVCHAAPGVEQGLPAVAMYPRPPRLDQAAHDMTPEQVFWVIKNGIKASGMPAWGASHSDEDIWSMVAFIQQLPQMSATDYQQIQQKADASGMGHHEHGNEGHSETDSGTHSHDMEHGDIKDAPGEQPAESANDHETPDASHSADGHHHEQDSEGHSDARSHGEVKGHDEDTPTQKPTEPADMHKESGDAHGSDGHSH